MQENRFRKVQTSYTYDKDNRETSAKTADKTNTTAYDALGRVTSKIWDTTAPHVTQYTYQAGADGSRSSQLAKVKTGSREIIYKYDRWLMSTMRAGKTFCGNMTAR